MHRITTILLFAFLITACTRSQVPDSARLVGGPCEGCEAVLKYKGRSLTAEDTLPDFDNSGQRIKISGTVYKPDGHTPAKGVILYVYHTNQQGIYPTRGNETGWAGRHGYIRGWMKTDEQGRYTFYTLKPAPYPNRSSPAHIHITVLEPNGRYYWLGSYHFAGDSLLTQSETNPRLPRGGSSGLLNLKREGGLWTGTRDIVLGENVPGYQ